jgi:hypothetical protein
MKTLFTSTKQQILKAFGLFGLFMILSMVVNPINAQNTERVITGVVNSLDGPLLGAVIVLKGTPITVISNENGGFTFPKELMEDDVLVVSYLGYETDEITIAHDTSFIEPFLEDIPIVIVATLRTKGARTSLVNKMN